MYDDYASNWMWFWRVCCFLPSVIVLYASQLYACKILYDLNSPDAESPLLLGESARCRSDRYQRETGHSRTLEQKQLDSTERLTTTARLFF
jgi:hypothetical protein